jgi:type IV pilus assembly protein PilW
MLLQSRMRRGVSLVELMVAIAVGLFLIGGVIQIYLSSKQSYNTQEQLARMQENGRFAMDLVTTDLRRAGYWGGLTLDPGSDLGDPGAEAPSNTCPSPDNDKTWGRMIDWPVSAVNDGIAGYNCIPTTGAGVWLRGDVLTVRYADYTPVTTTLGNDRLYLRTSSELGISAAPELQPAARIITGSTAGEADNALPVTGENEIEHELIARAYYVAQSGTTCSATGGAVPALWRLQLGDDGEPAEPMEIAPGAEQLQLQFLDDSGGYINADAVADWASVRAVRIWLLIRGHCPEAGLDNTTEYNIGDQSYQPNDNFPRQLYVSTVQLRNR